MWFHDDVNFTLRANTDFESIRYVRAAAPGSFEMEPLRSSALPVAFRRLMPAPLDDRAQQREAGLSGKELFTIVGA